MSRLKAESLKKLAGLQSRFNASMEHLHLSRAELPAQLEAVSAQTQAKCDRACDRAAW